MGVKEKRIRTPRMPFIAGGFLLGVMLGQLGVDAATSAKQAYKQFEKGNYALAREQFEKLLGDKPQDLRLHYNSGASAYRAGQFEAAVNSFDSASLSPDLELQQNAYYNLGNALYHLGNQAPDFEQKAEAWKNAILKYESALKLNEEDTQAIDNLNFIKKKLEELQQQQQQQQDQNQNQEDQEDNEEEQDQQNQDQTQQDDQEQKDQSNSEDQEQQDQQEQQPQESEDKEQENQQHQQEQEQNSQEQPSSDNQPSEESPPPPQGQMTPEQARQLLDAQKDKEQALIFRPPEIRRNQAKIFRDW